MMAYIEGVATDGRTSIGIAISPDGLKEWVRLQDEAILKPSNKGCWDDKVFGSPCLVNLDTKANELRLYYRGVGNGGRVGIGMAVCEG
ncbi:Glycosyl hydrolase, five-bladed beta-propellor domain superfamily [Sesbania bispinosa]|nr:Glycosyl hydrolase, five-bladed beta-propellor domain superfamily [Sesbania bispinosa]